MERSPLPLELPADLARGLEIAAAQAGKTPAAVVAEALALHGIEPLSEDQFEKRMTGSQ